MKAVVFRQHGGPEVLEYEDVPTPEPHRGEVLIEVKATSINHIDIFLRRGMPGIKVPFPKIAGSDASGIIREIGPDVSGLKVGQRVTINPGISCGHCEFCAAGFGSQCVSYEMIGESTGRRVRGIRQCSGPHRFADSRLTLVRRGRSARPLSS